MDIISSEFSGLLESDIRLPEWMSKLAEENKNAMRDDLDQIANPEQLGENDLFNGEDHAFLNESDMFTTPEQKLQQWQPDYVSLNTNHVEQEYDNVLRQNNSQTNNVNDEIEDLIKNILNDGLTLSSIQNMISEKFSNRIAFRYIKSNYQKLAEHFSDDLNLTPHEDRVEDSEIHDNYHLENQPKEAMTSTDDVIKEANSVFTNHTVKSLNKHLVNKFGQKLFDETFSNFNNYYKKQAGAVLDQIDNEFKTLTAKKTTKKDSINILQQKYGNFVNEYANSNNLDKIASFITKGSNLIKREVANTTVRDAQQKKKAESFQSKVMFDTIDIVAKQLLNSRLSSTECWSELQKRFGDKLAVYSKECLEKHAQFVNRKNDKGIEREAVKDETNVLKSKASVVDTAPMVREAYLRLMSRESLDSVKKTLINKYGSSVKTAINQEENNLKKVEHKLGYLYADANLFKNCDKMVDFFKKNLKYAFLLKEKETCKDCQMNIGNICKKTSLVLASNPLRVSKQDGVRIINALSDIKMVNVADANGYKQQLIDGDNTPVIKSFLEQAKNTLTSKKASRDVKETQNNDVRSFFDDVNDINVNQLTEKKSEFNLSF